MLRFTLDVAYVTFGDVVSFEWMFVDVQCVPFGLKLRWALWGRDLTVLSFRCLAFTFDQVGSSVESPEFSGYGVRSRGKFGSFKTLVNALVLCSTS